MYMIPNICTKTARIKVTEASINMITAAEVAGTSPLGLHLKNKINAINK